MRTFTTLLSMATLAVGLSATTAVWAEPSAPKGSTALPPEAPATVFIDAAQLLEQSKVLSDAWTRAVKTVFDAMKRVADVERLRPARTVYVNMQPLEVPGGWQTGAWSAVSPREQAAGQAVVEPAPMPIEPVTASIADTPGERGVLVGVQVTLPWLIP